MTMRNFRTADAVGDVLWAQWGALGVPALVEPSSALIDLEALIVATARFTDVHPDDRIRDGAISWLVRRSAYVSAPRMRRLQGRLDAAGDSAVKTFLADFVSAASSTFSWAKVLDPARAWIASTELAPLPLWGAATLRLRCRALFGSSAKAEAFARLVCSTGLVELAVLERDATYSRSQIDEGLSSLLDLGAVNRTMRGNSKAYGATDLGRQLVDESLRDLVTGPRVVDRLPVSTAATWIDWSSRFELLFALVEVQRLLDAKDVVGAFALLRDQAAAFDELRHPVPEPMQPSDALADVATVIRDWLPHAIERIAGRGLLP